MDHHENSLKRNYLKPAEAVKEFYSLQAKDIENLNLISSDMIDLNCFVCGNNETDNFAKVSGFEIRKCKKCSMVFVDKRPSKSKLVEYYQNSKASVFFQRNIIEPTRNYRIEKVILPRLKFINSIKTEKGNWLDIGCSTGILLEHGIKFGWKPFGIEFENYAIKECEKKGIKIYEENIENLNFRDQFELISMFEVLEHTFNPKEVLEACYNANKKNGILVLTTPNIEGIEFKFAGELHSNICPPNHLNYFSPFTIKTLLELIGYQVKILETPGLLDIDNMRNFKTKYPSMSSGNKMIDDIIKDDSPNGETLRNKLQELVIESNNSGNLRVVAVKR